MVLKAGWGGAGPVLGTVEEESRGSATAQVLPIGKGQRVGCSHFTVPFRLYVYIKVARGERPPCPWGR